jgi:hypothetical protein
MSESAADDLVTKVADAAKDVLYVSVGFSLLAFQRIQVRRRELQASLDSYLDRYVK